jgi:CheY-like chemotaxis protein
LNNAAKYTPDGGQIALALELADGWAGIHVRDNGLGLAPEQLEAIFQPFAQLDRSLGRADGGLGVGLALVRALIELHGGSVTATSAGPNSGAEFVVRLPLAKDDVGTPIAKPLGDEESSSAFSPVSPAALPGRVLVVDDNEDAAESLAALLEISGYEVRTAFDGLAALAVAFEFTPDAVILDLGMPGLSGYEVASRLRADERTRNAILVALTGWGQDDERRKTREAGFDHHLVKPIEPGALNTLLASRNGRTG